MDNLLYRREIPVMIRVFINPGRRPDQPEPTLRDWGDRDTNRPTEYSRVHHQRYQEQESDSQHQNQCEQALSQDTEKAGGQALRLFGGRYVPYGV
jgi:enterochelin esterase family protein